MIRLATVLTTLGHCAVALATSHHQDVTIDPIKNKAGKTTGAKITAVLSPDGHTLARFGVLPARADMLPGTSGLKIAIMDRNSKKWLARTPDITLDGKATEVELKVDYAKAGLKSGAKVQLGSVWESGNSSMHLWGVEWRANWGDPEVELP